MASRVQLIGVLFPTAPATPQPPTPPVIPPDPTESSPTYPDYQPTPGAIVIDSTTSSEGTASGTLPIQPSFSLPTTLRRRTNRHESSLAYSSVYARQESSRLAMTCTWWPLSQTDFETLRDFFDDRIDVDNQTSKPFTWQPPGESSGTYTVRGNPEYRFVRKAWRVTADLQELR